MAGPRSTHRWKQLTKKLRVGATYCPICGCLFNHDDPRSRRYPTVDHIDPLAQGGDPFDLANLRVICLSCNASRGATFGNQRRRTPAPALRPWNSRHW